MIIAVSGDTPVFQQNDQTSTILSDQKLPETNCDVRISEDQNETNPIEVPPSQIEGKITCFSQIISNIFKLKIIIMYFDYLIWTYFNNLGNLKLTNYYFAHIVFQKLK